MLIKKHLTEVIGKKSSLSCVAKDMLHDTESRFNMLLDHKHEDHQPLYAIATFLDVRYKSLIKGSLLSATKQVIIKDLRDANDGTSETESDEGSLDREQPPQSKHYRMDCRMYELVLQEGGAMEEEDNLPKRRGSITTKLTMAVEEYMKAKCDTSINPLEFWVQKVGDFLFRELASYAISTLTVPASSAPVERVFSTAGESTTGRRNRLSRANLEREVLLRRNKPYYIAD